MQKATHDDFVLAQHRNYSREELIRHASLTDSDIEQVKQCRRDYNCLGFGYQIGFVRLENRLPTQYQLEIIDDLLTFTSVQLQLDQNLISQYQKRRQTISQHQIRILDYLKLQRFEPKHRQLLSSFLFEESCRLEQTNVLLFLAEQFLRDKGILRPATSTLERIIGEQRTQAQQHIFERITNSLKGGVLEELDSLLVVGDDAVSPLQRLKAPPGAPSPSAMEGLMDKLARIQETGILDIDLSWLNNNYQRALAAYVRQCNAHRLREVEDYHRYGAMACFLWQTYQDTIDFAVDLHDKLITKMEKRAKTAFDLQLVKKRQSINKSLSIRGKVLQQNYSYKFRDYALEFYSFIADNYAPFYGTPIECNERDAPYVIDGLLYNESDLELEEHYTDTHGYTEINFAAFTMLGKRFCPRIRKISKQRIYRIDTQRDYGVLQPLLNRRDRMIRMDWVVDQWDRMGQFYAVVP